MGNLFFRTKEEKNTRKKKVFRRRWYFNPIFLMVALPVGIYISMIGYFFVNEYARGFYTWYRMDRAATYFENIKIEYENAQKADMYGGETPEETWELFLEALKKKDIELASKYFVVEKQEEWLENLEKIRKGEHLDEMYEDLSENYKKMREGVYEKYKADGRLYGHAYLSLNKFTKKWKISDL